ncbi:glycoside hydrolase family 88 protein [Demequina lutea]|uniref:Unsaturated rhamnogalacturonyl hydrolase n=1 Tax=Demequina lutea TaxID=431489 RepID=A0A7Y9ZCB8_9MICO|nr:glycoside hydrolase family 88 protein [Demequina lutea]NYI41603.1 unsaturated rhamnogalacturonyl hydrolase [Demequina lutea]
MSESPADRAELRERLWSALLAMQRLAWEQGAASQAALDEGRLDLARAIARDAVTHQDAEGRLGATGDSGLVNGGALGEAVALLATDGDDEAAVALERQRWWFLRWSPRDDEGVVWHLRDSQEVWVDSIYMVVPLLILTGDVAPADMQYRMHREHLWDEATGLYRHRVNTVTGERVRGAFWASGNGWAAAGIARALRIGGDGVPTDMRGRWQAQTRGLVDAVAAWETPDGRFHNVLNDPATFTDGTAGLMLAYAALTGVADGWLPSTYADSARRWMISALALVDAAGVLRGVAGASSFDREGTSAEAQAFALLALTASDAVI